jgi:hypothetical protein
MTPLRPRPVIVFLPLVVLLVLVVLVAATASACGSNNRAGYTEDDGGAAGPQQGGGGLDATLGSATEGGPSCSNLQCKVAKCSAGTSTTVSGTVYDPAGTVPLYNAIVYVPNAPVAPFADGVTCDRCGTQISGSPVTTTLTGADGKFVLKDVPDGTNIPLVIQVGKWRRQTTLPTVQRCADNPITKADQTRLPRNHTEGDLPKIAMVTGGCDHMECLLLNIGIDAAEFTAPTGTGRVHMYQGTAVEVAPATLTTGTPAASTLWSSAATMKQYDIVVDGCECTEVPSEKPQSTVDNHVAYVNSGGRLFTADYQYYWMAPGITNSGVTSPWSTTANFKSAPGAPRRDTATVDTSFPKGQAFADWLQNVGATTQKGQLPLSEAFYRASSVNPPSTRWLYGNNALFHYTFNAPVGGAEEAQCGKVVFSDFHVVGGVGSNVFPGECSSLAKGGAEQRALEFMLFDLSACIQNDGKPPAPPPVR